MVEEDFILVTGFFTGNPIYIKYDRILAIKPGEAQDQYWIYLNDTEDYFKVKESKSEILEKIDNLKKIRKQNKKKIF